MSDENLTGLRKLFMPNNTYLVSQSFIGDLTTDNVQSKYRANNIITNMARSICEEGTDNENLFGVKEIPAKIMAEPDNKNYVRIITKNGFEIVLAIQSAQFYDGKVVINEFVKEQ